MMKKLLVVFFFSLIIIFIIYKLLNKNNLYYLAIGDDIAKGHTPFDTYSDSYIDLYYEYLKTKYNKVTINKDYLYEDIRIKDLNTLLNDNYNINTLSQEITKADIITISIGSEELFSKLRSNFEITDNTEKIIQFIDNMFNELELLINNIRKLNKKEIFIIGYYNPLKTTSLNESYIKSIFNYIDKKFINMKNKYDIKYIEINNEFVNQNYRFLPNINNSFPSIEAHKYISERIIKES